LKWSRFEALASINSVEMVDFPLSSSQVSIETEFSSSEGKNTSKLQQSQQIYNPTFRATPASICSSFVEPI
jgi:hypothetical protein